VTPELLVKLGPALLNTCLEYLEGENDKMFDKVLIP